MNPLSTIISAAVAEAVSANVKLFDPKKIERAPEALSRDVMRYLTRAAKDGEDAPEAEEAPPFEWVAADDLRAKGFVNLRAVAGCLARAQTNALGAIYVPREANNVTVRAFAELPPPALWRPVSQAQQAAWHDCFERALGAASRRPMGDSTRLPWPWPPSKEGQVYPFDDQQEMPT